MGNSDDMLSMNNLYEHDLHDSVGQDCPDIAFAYDDTDAHMAEIAELYSYTEHPEFSKNVKAFEDQMEAYNLPPSWQKLSQTQKKSIVLKLMDQLDLSTKSVRMKAARCILYLAQGCWAEVQSDNEQQQVARDNVMLLYELGIFTMFVELLSLEIENATTANVAMRKVAVSLADSVDLRVILSVLYIITEVIRNEMTSEQEEFQQIVENFKQELLSPIGDEILIVKLLVMITRFCSGSAPHFPMKKVLLLLWKISLVSLGGMETLKKLKNEYRAKAGLPPMTDDTLEVGKSMRASSPPALASDMIDNQNPKRNRPFRRSLMKQSSLDEQEQINMEVDTPQSESEEEISEYYRTYDDPTTLNSDTSGTGNGSDTKMSNSNKPDWMFSPEPQLRIISRLPWTPKVRQKDIDMFLDVSRTKFIGYTLPDDRESLAGLPQPIHESVKTLKNHMYVSLADVQIKKEEEIDRNPISTSEGEIEMTPAEILYQAILPNLPQCMIALLKILLAAAPTSKAKTESINIMADVLPETMPITVTQSTKLGIDVNRHKEIIVKAVSAILLLYLKHLKINHIYQFEFMSQHLVFANCIPLVLKFFNQDIMGYVGSKNTIPIMDFPACVIGEQPELNSDSMVIGDSAPYSWRNIFSCINLLRILNKLIKWKHSRIMMLVVFKSAPILKRTLKVRHGLMQLYVLKLLKIQTKYLGRQWRKVNMKTISAIYSKVRHRLNDDWAFGNDLDARPWDFQAEECTLRACVDRFNNRRYLSSNASGNNRIASGQGEMIDLDGVIDLCANDLYGQQGRCIQSAAAYSVEDVELSEEFKEHYHLWLEEEVYSMEINWDALMVKVE
ncbi:striatin-interacting protein 1 homolog isoform X4 [Phlebotomus papatasi]|uniref:striatin-interacting protein 1 homolog isoform X4 n=1 Tax=Phlebotomus papatasi TaxID=29031 RepID=UPI00248459B1|nr:striatin-interacting protein 1 homolog isoform X4 [Phlebotomus papatasi]